MRHPQALSFRRKAATAPDVCVFVLQVEEQQKQMARALHWEKNLCAHLSHAEGVQNVVNAGKG